MGRLAAEDTRQALPLVKSRPSTVPPSSRHTFSEVSSAFLSWSAVLEAEVFAARSREAEDGVPTLQRVCERAVARELVEPRSVCGVLLYADAAGAGMLRQHCLVRSPPCCRSRVWRTARRRPCFGPVQLSCFATLALGGRACSIAHTVVHPCFLADEATVPGW